MEEKTIAEVERAEKIIRTAELVEKTIHFGDNVYMNVRYYVDKGDEYYRGMKLIDFERLCTCTLHEFQDMLGENNSEELVRYLDMFIGILEMNLYDDYYTASDEELFAVDEIREEKEEGGYLC